VARSTYPYIQFLDIDNTRRRLMSFYEGRVHKLLVLTQDRGTSKLTSRCPVSGACSSPCQRTAWGFELYWGRSCWLCHALKNKVTGPFPFIALCSLGEHMSEAAMECVWPAPGSVCQQPVRATRQRGPVQVCHKNNDRETLRNIRLFLAAHVLRHQEKARPRPFAG
jgi:hypothetical protein